MERELEVADPAVACHDPDTLVATQKCSHATAHTRMHWPGSATSTTERIKNPKNHHYQRHRDVMFLRRKLYISSQSSYPWASSVTTSSSSIRSCARRNQNMTSWVDPPWHRHTRENSNTTSRHPVPQNQQTLHTVEMNTTFNGGWWEGDREREQKKQFFSQLLTLKLKTEKRNFYQSHIGN
jgi:hypothetical protein